MADTTPPAAASDRQAGRGILIAACVSAFVDNANTSAVTILLPAISKDLNAPIAQLQWAVTGYMLVGAAVIVTAGALGDVFGRRLIFLGGLGLFVASCVLIALSSSADGVIIGRMIQGAAGAALGPVVCGVLADTTGWQGLFWIDAAIAAACVPLTLLTVKESRDPNRSHSIDILGSVLVALVLAPLVLA